MDKRLIDSANTQIEGMMEVYLQPEPDGLHTSPFGSWAAEKLDYLRRYIDVFETSMREKWARRNYIDLFAGPGKWHVDGEKDRVNLGSPLLALTAPHPFTGYYFVDRRSTNIGALRQRCQAHSSYSAIKFYEGDSNTIVRDIVDEIRAADSASAGGGRWSSLNLAFLDPAKPRDLKWDTVALLTTVNKMDLIIHYPLMGLKRSIPQVVTIDKETVVDRFFGGTEWRAIYTRYQSREVQFLHRALIDHYRNKLQELGYADVTLDEETGDEPLIRNARKNAPLYRLLFASKHPLGHDFWHKVTRRDVYGQGRLL